MWEAAELHEAGEERLLEPMVADTGNVHNLRMFEFASQSKAAVNLTHLDIRISLVFCLRSETVVEHDCLKTH